MLPLDFYLQKTEIVAKELINSVLVKKLDNGSIISGRIVETEAYLSNGDLASHSACGKTNRNSMMFENGGLLYVYLIYGIHHCINVVTESQGTGSAVLIRAIEPLEGIEIMKINRKVDDLFKLCKGPANLAKAFNFTLSNNGLSLTSNNLYILPAEIKTDIKVSKRIGITKSNELLLRFYVDKSKFVSK